MRKFCEGGGLGVTSKKHAYIKVMRFKYILIFIALFYSYLCRSQEISGQVKDGKSGKPIPFANIGIIGKDIGTITGLDGIFSLELSKATDGDTLRFSFVGYEPLNLLVNYIRKNGFPNEVLLKEEIVELKEVIVASDRLTPKMLGIRRKDCYPIPLYKKITSNIPFPQPGYRHEIGTFFANNQPVYLDSIQFNFTDIQIDTVTLRINIYVYVEDHFKNVLNEPLYINFQSSDESQQIDVSHLGIQLESNFLVSIENYGRINDNSLNILANFKSKGKKYPTYYRRNTQSNWVILKSKSQDFGISFLVYVRQ